MIGNVLDGITAGALDCCSTKKRLKFDVIVIESARSSPDLSRSIHATRIKVM